MHLAYIWIVSHLSAKNYRNWWKFDEVLTKTNLLSFFGTRCSFGRVCLSVCLSVSQTITFASFDVRCSYLYIRYISREYESSLYMKVIGSSSRSQEPKGRKFIFLLCETSIGNNSGTKKKHRAVKFACSMGFSTMANRIVRSPFLLSDRK